MWGRVAHQRIGTSARRLRSARDGLTIVEVLVALAVLGLLLALLLPAVTEVRRAARQTECQNHLHQLGTAVHAFEATHRFYPSNGWGFLWIGDPDRGVGPKQPGGWIYQLLPFVDAKPLAELGKGAAPGEKAAALRALTTRPLELFRCPARPAEDLALRNATLTFRNVDVGPVVAKTDYAINEGDYITNTPGGPLTLAEGDDPAYPWTDVRSATGVSFLRSRVRPADLRDGASHVYLIGEKVVSRSAYADASDDGHDAPLYSGVDLDINRWTIDRPLPDGFSPEVRRFGSAHPAGCYFVLCDGSVRFISYLVDRNVHRSYGNRLDGQGGGL